MRSRFTALTSLTFVSLFAVAILALQGAKGIFGSAPIGLAAQNPSYNLNITSLSASNKTLNTSNGNPIFFIVDSYGEGSFSADGAIRNKTAISGLESITVTGLQAGASLDISYGWADGDYDVTDGIIDSDHLVYTFGNESPSFFEIRSSVATAVTGILLSYSCNPTDEPTDYVLTFESTGEGEYQVTGCKKNVKTVAIPSSYRGKPVTSIGNSAFFGCSSLQSISIPAGVNSIDEHAFYGCSSLASVVIPEGVTSIGNGAFCNCASLTSIVIPSAVAFIGDGAFSGCVSLESISVDPDNQTYDSRGGCNAIIETATGKLLLGCASTILPEGVTSIGNDSFVYSPSITAIVIPSTVTSIGALALSSFPSLASISVAPANPVYDSRGGCNAIIETSSGTLVAGCSSTVIPEGVTSIVNFAFGGCSLESVVIPSTVASIGDYAFDYCSSLASISVAPANPVYDSRGCCNAIIETATGKLVLGCGSTVIPEGVTSLGDNAFSGCSSLTAIVIPSTVISIGNAAFVNCSALASVVIPEEVASIGDNAFWGCSSLTTMIIPEGVASIGAWAFNYCPSLVSVVIPFSVTSIGYAAFSQFSSPNLVIYCKASEKPTGWNSNWTVSCPVVWGYVGD